MPGGDSAARCEEQQLAPAGRCALRLRCQICMVMQARGEPAWVSCGVNMCHCFCHFRPWVATKLSRWDDFVASKARCNLRYMMWCLFSSGRVYQGNRCLKKQCQVARAVCPAPLETAWLPKATGSVKLSRKELSVSDGRCSTGFLCGQWTTSM